MKYMIALLSLLTISSTVFAAPASLSKCEKTVLRIAKMTLDQKAKAYTFTSSDIMKDSLSKSQSSSSQSTYVVSGYIYKAGYDVLVTVDSSCGLESVLITENGLQ